MPAPFSLAHIRFFAGPKPGGQPLEIDVPTVVLLVGPNNSGKSLVLRELEWWARGRKARTSNVVMESARIRLPKGGDETVALAEAFRVPGQTTASQIQVSAPSFFKDSSIDRSVHEIKDLWAAGERQDEQALRSYLGALFTVRLDGRTRFALSDEKPVGDLLGHAENHLWALFQNDSARERVRQFTKEAFGLYFVLDPTNPGRLRVRMSSRPPATKTEEQSYDVSARTFHNAAPLLTDLSDGMQTFTGLVSALLSSPHRTILIDEPEAFLHPPLARRLGNNLTTLAAERDASLVVATHSADFMMGCIEAGANVAIVRLTYEQPAATARAIKPSELRQLMLDPLLKSTQALRGIFHRGVIVAEADRDRAFYEEVNTRLQQHRQGMQDVQFVNAQNWQTTARIIGPLRHIGIPAAAIIDLDTVAEPGPWPAFYAAAALDPQRCSQIDSLRTAAATVLRQDTQRSYKTTGLTGFSAVDAATVKAFLEAARQVGIFVVPVGAVEQWLSQLGISAPKREWLAKMFTRMGADPAVAGYVTPQAGDVWAFVEQVGAWIGNPQRSGMP